MEIDIAGEHLGQLHRDAVRDADRVGRGKQRAADDACFHRDARLERGLLLERAEALALRHDPDQRVAAREEAQGLRRAIGEHVGADQGARAQRTQCRRTREARDRALFEPEPAEKTGERVAALELLLLDVLPCGGNLARLQGERFDDHGGWRHGRGLVARRDGGERRHHAGSGEDRDRCGTPERAGQLHGSARIPFYSEACAV